MQSKGIHRRVTEAEFIELPATSERIELLDGEVLMAPSPTVEHQALLAELVTVLQTWRRGHTGYSVAVAPLDIRFGPGRILQPDLCLFTPPHRGPLPVTQIPVLVIEILSTNRSYDRILKRSVYAEAGVAEYWLVDPEDRVVEQVQGLTSIGRCGEVVRSLTAPDLVVDLATLFGAVEW